MSCYQFEIKGKTIGGNNPCFIIGEIAQAHDGSLGMAHAFIDAISRAGADAVKFQTHIADAESSPEEPWRVKFSYEDDTRFDYWKRMEFTKDQWIGLKKHAEDAGLVFLSSPFSIEAAELLYSIGMPAWKIASGEVSNSILLDYIIETRLPTILSTGMSSMCEIDKAVERFQSKGIGHAVLQCTTQYPCPPEKVGLNMIPAFQQRYQCPIGYSDHSGTIYPGLAAMALGAKILEVHVTLSREAFGPDVPASVTTTELRQLVEGSKFIEKAVGNNLDKDVIYNEMIPLRDLFTKSVAVRTALMKGTVLTRECLTVKKPGIGIPASAIDTLIGKRLVNDVEAGQLLKLKDIGENEE